MGIHPHTTTEVLHQQKWWNTHMADLSRETINLCEIHAFGQWDRAFKLHVIACEWVVWSNVWGASPPSGSEWVNKLTLSLIDPDWFTCLLLQSRGDKKLLTFLILINNWCMRLPVVSSHGRFITSYGRFVTVSSSHLSYLIKGVLGVQHFVITP